MKLYVRIAFSFFLLGLILGACAQKASYPPPPSQEKTTIPSVTAKEAWEIAWDKLVAGAKKEGKVRVVSSVGPEVRQAMGDGFNKLYPILSFQKPLTRLFSGIRSFL